jgi:hypothetical protein
MNKWVIYLTLFNLLLGLSLISETKFLTRTRLRAKLNFFYIWNFTFLEGRREGEMLWTDFSVFKINTLYVFNDK